MSSFGTHPEIFPDFASHAFQSDFTYMSLQPVQTLYVTNLNERAKAADIVALLYELFSTCGDVVGVHVAKGKKRRNSKPLRGTAFVSFRNVPQATAAIRTFHKFSFLGKPLTVQYAASKSDSVAEFLGQFKPRFKAHKPVAEEEESDEGMSGAE